MLQDRYISQKRASGTKIYDGLPHIGEQQEMQDINQQLTLFWAGSERFGIERGDFRAPLRYK